MPRAKLYLEPLAGGAHLLTESVAETQLGAAVDGVSIGYMFPKFRPLSNLYNHCMFNVVNFRKTQEDRN